MQNICFLCDFDGTITEKDGLYGFFEKYADKNWIEIEKLWENSKINSKECLNREFESVSDLSENLIDDYIKTVKIDKYFKIFQEFVYKYGFDICILSDGVDYFINKILINNNISNIKIISNHFEFEKEKFKLSFPNCDNTCKKNSGTCKCSVLKRMKERYKKVIYIGDGVSDYCVCDKADILFAKSKLASYCKEKNIKNIEFQTFKDITDYIFYNNCNT